MEGNGVRWALWSQRQLKVIKKGEGSGLQWGLLCARHGPGACNTLAPWGRCCILTSQMRKKAQKDEGAYLGSHSQPVAVGLGFRKSAWNLLLANGRWWRRQDLKPFQQRAGGKGSPPSQAVL